MKHTIIFLFVTIALWQPKLGYSQSPSYPDYFSWQDRFSDKSNFDNYISSAKDQLIQGPCAAFAATGLLEAAIQIYFNIPITETEMDLS